MRLLSEKRKNESPKMMKEVKKLSSLVKNFQRVTMTRNIVCL